ncbi:hypothetical protein [Aquibacillus albus]|uniref:Uncharacterized protein n=1 Tax=Aquibacillus albus TaxID=1168171 RepID=A0ABS2N2L0_9BACI|nr:hypothetical protein [Aquibacillus albus]MBM7572365.1 hypothetical protein [Aquibacillus albus]
MIVDMDVRCHLYGDEFSPIKVEEITGLTIDNKMEVGVIGTRGKYKGTPISYDGQSLITSDGELLDTNDINFKWKFCDKLLT